MGLFDNSVVNKFIPNQLKPDKSKPTRAGLEYIYEQQVGCGAKVYPNGESRKVQHLFWEIISCSVDRTITDIGGGFSLVLAPTAPWDELIQPDDFIRIFMGDQISQSDVPLSAFNFASGELNLNWNGIRKSKSSVVTIPLPDIGYKYNEDGVSYNDKKGISQLVMYERMLGKIDRVEKIEDPAQKNSGMNVYYVVTGRSIGSIIQDISLYYNEWLPGLNAVNVFFGANISLFQSPSEFVQEFLSVVLSAIPLPQWQLPQTLIDDMDWEGIREENIELIQKNIDSFRSRLNDSASQNQVEGLQNAVTELTQLLNQAGNNLDRSVFSILSFKGVKETYGETFNKSFLNSVTTGLYDLVKHLSNNIFNEFWIDLCPEGDVNSGNGLFGTLVPTVVMRQRPYDITERMLTGLTKNPSAMGEKISKFEPEVIENVSNSLFDLDKSSFSVFGSLQNSDLTSLTKNLNDKFFEPTSNYSPHQVKYQCGVSGHDRLNGFLCLGNFNRGQSNQTDRIALAANNGFKVDIDSIKKYGLRMMEVSTIYAQPNTGDEQQKSWVEILKKFSTMLANWYFMNPVFLNGKIKARFLPEARIGVPCKYYQTRLSPDNPYPKMEIFYVQGVTDEFQFGQGLNTTLTVIRGLRYTLEKTDEVKKEAKKLVSLRQKVKNFFSFT